jgi:esterase/lipase superfamily enzyme
MPKYWMISNRDVEEGRGLGTSVSEPTFWIADGEELSRLSSWTPIQRDPFCRMLADTAGQFPVVPLEEHEKQKHVALFIHGYNTAWDDAVHRYQRLCKSLFQGKNGLGLCVLFSWPSNGKTLGYLPDREDARQSATTLAEVLSELYRWLAAAQHTASLDPNKACRAKTSVIAHSMGNYVLQCAMQAAWTRNNQPLRASLINQLLMVAADVDNDLFRSGENIDKGDGDAIANLTYRVTALFSSRDPVLGLSAGLKHFGKRRLGRSGLDRSYPIPDNVWQVDCSTLFDQSTKDRDVHSAYFESKATLELMRATLRGLDRALIDV